MAELADAGVRTIVGLVLAPHYSGASVGEYQRRLAEAAEPRGAMAVPDRELAPAPRVHRLPGRARSPRRGRRCPTDHKVLFTAHSLPERVLAGDPYPDQLRASATQVAAAAGLARWAGWSIALAERRSHPRAVAGPRRARGDPRARRPPAGPTAVCVCPQGFVSDHLEVLYDLDIEADAGGRGGGPGLRPHPRAQRRPGRASARSPTGCSRVAIDATSSWSAAASPAWPPPTR